MKKVNSMSAEQEYQYLLAQVAGLRTAVPTARSAKVLAGFGLFTLVTAGIFSTWLAFKIPPTMIPTQLRHRANQFFRILLG
jgi:hypothetical protein